MEMLGYPSSISSPQACGNTLLFFESGLRSRADLCSQLMCRIGCCLASAVFPGADGSRSTPVSGSRKEGSEAVRESSPNTPLAKALGGCWELMKIPLNYVISFYSFHNE